MLWGRHLSGQGFVFICGRRAVEGQEDAQTGSCRAVFTGAVNAIAAAQRLHPAQHILSASGRDIVKVQGDDVTPGHIVSLAARAG